MSQISDVGVNFKMSGADSFESRLKSLESQWKSFSGSFNQTPEINKHFNKMTSHIAGAEKKISRSLSIIKAGLVGILAAKGAGAAFEWGLGSDVVAQKKIFAQTHMSNLEMYEEYFSEIRDKHRVTRDDLISGAFEINSALSTRPDDEKIESFKMMTYYMNELGGSFTEAAQFYKKLMSSFGNTMPLEKQKTAAKDFLGYLNTISRESSSNPTDIAKGVGTVGASYGKRGWTAEDMFAHLGYLIPTMKSPDEAANALLRITEKSPEYGGKLAAAQYRMDFMAGRVAGGKGGQAFKSYEEMLTASKESAFPDRQKAAIHALGELRIGEEHYQKEAEKQIEQYISQRRPDKIFDMLNRQVEDVQKRSANPETTLKNVFSEYSGPAISLLRGFATGEIERLKQKLQNSSGQQVMDQVDTAKLKQLPENWGIVKQKAEDFSTSLRSIFYEPMKALLEEWKFVFTNLEKSLGGESGLKKIQSFSGNFVGGFREGRNNGLPIAEDNRSLGQIFQEFVASLNPQDFRNAGKMIGKAASDFVTIASQLKDIVATAHGMLSYLGLVKTAGAAALMPGPWPVKAAVGVGVGVHELSQNESIKAASEKLDKMGIFSAPPFNREKKDQTDLMLPAHKSTGMIAPPVSSDGMITSHRQNEVVYSPKNDIQVSVHLNGKEIAQETAPEVKEMLEADQGRNRGNALDQPLMAN